MRFSQYENVRKELNKHVPGFEIGWGVRSVTQNGIYLWAEVFIEVDGGVGESMKVTFRGDGSGDPIDAEDAPFDAMMEFIRSGSLRRMIALHPQLP